MINNITSIVPKTIKNILTTISFQEKYMKQLISLVITFLTIAVNAEVVKPKDTLEIAKGVAYVENVAFNYSVGDRGWQTRASNDSGKIYMEAVKSFVLDYSTQGENQLVNSSIESSLPEDAEMKCIELGNIEYVDQTKNYTNYQTSVIAEIVSGRAEKFSKYTAFGSFVCLITITVNN